MESMVNGFIEGLKEARNLYAKCPNCDEIISLHDSPPFYLKTAPENILTQASQRITIAKNKVKEERKKWEHKLELSDKDWGNKLKRKDTELRAFKSNRLFADKKIIAEHTSRAIRSMKSQYTGRLGEMLPMIDTKSTGINPFELCFLKPQPIDFIGFNGLMKKDVKSIVFLDVKTGHASLTPTQKSIRRAIERNRIEFRTVRLNPHAIGKENEVKEE